MEVKSDWDAIVIGGGLAGSAAAIQMAQARQRVLLLEKQKQAHHKVCGEFISYEAQRYLKELGLDLIALGAVPIQSMRLIRRNQIVEIELPFQGLSLSRYRLDEALLQLTLASGATIMRSANAINLEQKTSAWQLDFEDTTHGSVQGKSVFLATGKHDLRGYPRPAGLQNDLIGFKMHFQASTMLPYHNTVDVILFEGGYAGVEQVENNTINLCLVISKKAYAALGKSWDSLLTKLLNEIPALAARLQNTSPCWPKPLAIFGIPYGLVQTAYTPQLYALGDQIAVIPSFCGNGMSIALYTAQLAVQHYLNGTTTAYQQMAYQTLKTRVVLASCLSQLVVNSYGQILAFKSCQILPSCLKFIAKKTRIFPA